MLLRHFILLLPLGALLACSRQARPSQKIETQVVAQSTETTPDFRGIASKAVEQAKSHHFEELENLAQTTKDPVGRSLVRLIQLRFEPRRGPQAFINSFPGDGSTEFWWSQVDTIIPTDAESSGLRLPGESRDLSAWSIPNALLSLAINGNRMAFSKWLQLTGDGEYGEGLSTDFANLVENHPKLIVQNWNAIRASRYGHDLGWPFLEDESDPADAKRFEKMRSTYTNLLSPKDSRRAEILKMLTPPLPSQAP